MALGAIHATEGSLYIIVLVGCLGVGIVCDLEVFQDPPLPPHLALLVGEDEIIVMPNVGQPHLKSIHTVGESHMRGPDIIMRWRWRRNRLVSILCLNFIITLINWHVSSDEIHPIKGPGGKGCGGRWYLGPKIPDCQIEVSRQTGDICTTMVLPTLVHSYLEKQSDDRPSQVDHDSLVKLVEHVEVSGGHRTSTFILARARVANEGVADAHHQSDLSPLCILRCPPGGDVRLREVVPPRLKEHLLTDISFSPQVAVGLCPSVLLDVNAECHTEGCDTHTPLDTSKSERDRALLIEVEIMVGPMKALESHKELHR
ncbi:unnamed protein product [Linum trigynum]|uniref:Uncharacterized protein n=1 Tax=Linum trigynum TaxID=586398 RepID=A0AAV2F7V2_9ROSI